MTHRIGVVGAGAIGGWVAARLALAGEPVMALTSRGALDKVEVVEDGAIETARFDRFDGPADILIIAVKATAMSSVAQTLSPRIGPSTVVVPMLNGVPWWFIEGEPLHSVDPEGAIARSIPFNQIVGCVVHASCSRPAPGRIEVKHADKLLIGEPGREVGERVAELFGLLDRAGLRPDMTNNVRRAIWYKLWGNATINPLSAMTRATADQLLADPVVRAFMAEAMAELAEIGAAIGCPITESSEDRMAVTARLGAFRPSMLQDVEAGRLIELEALVGAPLEIARRHGMATPSLDRIYSMTRLMAENLALL